MRLEYVTVFLPLPFASCELILLSLLLAVEKDLTLLGCTAIEDKLQAGVPDAIRQLRAAGVKVWMLTGDKASTALQIAVSCNMAAPLSESFSYDFTGEADRRWVVHEPSHAQHRCAHAAAFLALSLFVTSVCPQPTHAGIHTAQPSVNADRR